MKMLMWTLWPAFLIAIPACGIYFSLFNPVDIDILGTHIGANAGIAYTVGFFAFWMLGSLSSALTLWLSKT